LIAKEVLETPATVQQGFVEIEEHGLDVPQHSLPWLDGPILLKSFAI
jgi:hypothetical protein